MILCILTRYKARKAYAATISADQVAVDYNFIDVGSIQIWQGQNSNRTNIITYINICMWLLHAHTHTRFSKPNDQRFHLFPGSNSKLHNLGILQRSISTIPAARLKAIPNPQSLGPGSVSRPQLRQTFLGKSHTWKSLLVGLPSRPSVPTWVGIAVSNLNPDPRTRNRNRNRNRNPTQYIVVPT